MPKSSLTRTILTCVAVGAAIFALKAADNYVKAQRCEEYRDIIGKTRAEKIVYIRETSPHLGPLATYRMADSLDDHCE